jgi:hypothetical protein
MNWGCDFSYSILSVRPGRFTCHSDSHVISISSLSFRPKGEIHVASKARDLQDFSSLSLLEMTKKVSLLEMTKKVSLLEMTHFFVRVQSKIC